MKASVKKLMTVSSLIAILATSSFAQEANSELVDADVFGKDLSTIIRDETGLRKPIIIDKRESLLTYGETPTGKKTYLSQDEVYCTYRQIDEFNKAVNNQKQVLPFLEGLKSIELLQFRESSDSQIIVDNEPFYIGFTKDLSLVVVHLYDKKGKEKCKISSQETIEDLLKKLANEKERRKMELDGLRGAIGIAKTSNELLDAFIRALEKDLSIFSRSSREVSDSKSKNLPATHGAQSRVSDQSAATAK